MKNLFIDGGNLIHRCYHSAINNPIITDDGKNVGQIYHFLNHIKQWQEQFDADRIFIAWDMRDKDFVNFRQEESGYKEHRDKSKDKDVHKHDKIIWKMCEMLGINSMRASKLEADDIIYFLCKKYEDDDNIIASSDKDFLQLFNYFYNIKIFSPIKNVLIDPSNLIDFTEGVTIDRYLVYRSIVGDTSDNIKGIFRVGPKKAKIIVEDIENKLTNLSTENKAIVKKNMKMMDLRKGIEEYPDEADYYEEQIDKPDQEFSKFFDIADKLQLDRISKNRSSWEAAFSNGDEFDALKNMFGT